MISAKIQDAIDRLCEAERDAAKYVCRTGRRDDLISAIERELQLPRILARDCYLELIDLAKRLHLHIQTHAKGAGK